MFTTYTEQPATKKEADRIVNIGRGATWSVASVTEKAEERNPRPPFTTSTLQQTASTRLGFAPSRTMRAAQKLYEAGHITYMRTDSVNLSEDALSAAKVWLTNTLGETYAKEAPRVFKKKSRLAQEAHEAIRPTLPDFAPQNLGGPASFASKEEEKLYDLIWRRFMASQMPQAKFNATRVEFSAEGARLPDGQGSPSGGEGKKMTYTFSANGNTLLFDGFLKVWPTKFIEKKFSQL